MSKKYHRTPAELYFIQDEFLAWSFNRAVFMFGSEMEADLDASEKGAKTATAVQKKRQMCFDKWMRTGLDEETAPPRKFADPAARMKKVKDSA